ncbi:MAG: sigma 54-interacting transcriptional regulator [Myxococcales bacterium]|nr:sigma 54-interacting transcriptional regulator [Myxococcales bacterium]
MAGTLTPAMGIKRSAPAAPPVAALYVALQCERPGAPTSRHLLTEIDKVAIGRGEHPAVVRRANEMILTLADTWMSQKHAILRLSGARWIVEDAGSRNGTLVNGAPCTRAVLKDGDVVELGHTLLLFREKVAARPPLDLDAKQLEAPAHGLASFAPGLMAETARLRTIARSTVSVVIHGESGSGKEIAARALHQLSGRPGPFVAVNCGGIAKNLVESEMFGYRKGAFSGADEDRPGLMRSADKGTLFLDEIADLPSAAQAVLLRALQESEVVPVGATRPVKIDVRVLAATHYDLQEQIAEGAFRADLFARISGFTVRLPPLRERREDLGLLIGEILKRLTPDAVQLTPAAARALFAYQWPLNVRELEKCLATAVILAAGQPIDVQHLPDWAHPSETPVAQKPVPPPTEDDIRQRDELLALLKEHRGNVSSIARAMGKARMQVQRWLKRYGLDPEEFR